MSGKTKRWLVLAIFFAASQISSCSSDHETNNKAKDSTCPPKTDCKCCK